MKSAVTLHYAHLTSQANFLSTNSFETIPLKGLKIGCLSSESFRLSTLECFYDQSYINLIQEHIYSKNSMVSALKRTSRFSLNTTLDQLTRNTFIEQLRTQINYSLYYEQCSPLLCSYTYIQYIDLIYTATFLLGLQDGLPIVLKWMSPKLIRIFYSIYRHRQRRKNVVQVQTTMQIVNLTIDLPSVPTRSDSRRHNFLSIRSLCTCLTLISLLITVILFSIYIKPSENITTSTSTSTFTTISISFNSTLLTTTTTTYRPDCAVIFENRWLYTAGSRVYPQLPVVSDFNNDDHLDIAFTLETTADIILLLGNGNGTFLSAIQNSIVYSDPLENLVVDDINNDEKLDIMFVDTSLRCIGVVFGNGNGTFELKPHCKK